MIQNMSSPATSIPSNKNIALLEQKAELVNLIDKVKSFPDQISYDVLVPLSKVGFCPGKIVHTNEFMVTKSGEVPANDSISSSTHPESFQTHSEVVALLHSKLMELENALGVKRTEFAPNLSSKTNNKNNCGSSSSSSSNGVATRKIDTNAKPPIGSLSKAVQSNKPVAKELKKNQPKEESDDPIYEIREYIDASGATKFEKVDVTQQFRAMNNMATETAKDGQSNGETLLEKQLQQGGDASFADSGDLSFVRELCENSDMINSSNNSSSSSSNDNTRTKGTTSGDGGEEEEIDLEAMFAKLETQEEELEKRQQQKRQQQKSGSAVAKQSNSNSNSNSSGGGWSSGFLKKAKPAVATTAATANTTNTNTTFPAKTAPPPAAAAAVTSVLKKGSTEGSEGVVKQGVRFADFDEDLTDSGTGSRQEERKKGESSLPNPPVEVGVAAFTGSVMERQASSAGPKPLVIRGTAAGRGAGRGLGSGVLGMQR